MFEFVGPIWWGRKSRPVASTLQPGWSKSLYSSTSRHATSRRFAVVVHPLVYVTLGTVFSNDKVLSAEVGAGCAHSGSVEYFRAM